MYYIYVRKNGMPYVTFKPELNAIKIKETPFYREATQLLIRNSNANPKNK